MGDPTVEARRRGFWMRMAREYADMSQETAAQELGLSGNSKSTLSAWEAGRRDPKAAMIVRMAALYGVPAELLFEPPQTAFEMIEARVAARDQRPA